MNDASHITLGEEALEPTEAQAQMRKAFAELMATHPKTMIVMMETGKGSCMACVVGSPLDVAALLEVGDKQVEQMLWSALSAQRLNG